MLRNDTQVALNDALSAVRESADLYADDIEALDASPLAKVFDELRARRLALAAALEEEVRRAGDLPKEPDADRETLHRLGERLQAALGNERRVFLADRLRGEEELLALAERALARPLPDSAADVLGAIRAEAAQARDRLAALLARE